MQGIKLTFLIGAPGSDKKYYAKKLVQDFGYERISLGQIFHEEINKGTLIGNRIKGSVEKKKLLEDELVVDTIQNLVEKNNIKNLLLDGFPKTMHQAILLEELLGECSVVIELSTKPELLTKKIMAKLAEQGKAKLSEEEIKGQINDYTQRTQAILQYYRKLGKVRAVDCSKPVAEVYRGIQKAILASIYFVVGAKSSGKSVVCKHLAEVTGLKVINFAEWMAGKFGNEPIEVVLASFIKELHKECNMKMAIEGFPRNLSEFKYIILNGVNPNKIIYVNATEGRCMQNGGTDLTCRTFKAFQQQLKELYTFGQKSNLIYEVRNSEETSLQELKDNAMKIFVPEVILLRQKKDNRESINAIFADRSNEDLVVDVEDLEVQEIIRRTKIGSEIKDMKDKKQRIQSAHKIELLKKVIYSTSENKRVLLFNFPKTVKEVQEFEKECCPIYREFFFCKDTKIEYDEYSIETYFHAKEKLVPIANYLPDLFNAYRGFQLQYALIAGPVASGKTFTAKYLAKYGFTFLELEALAEDIKKRLATEDNPAEGITVSFAQKLEELRARTLGRKSNDEKFVLDGLDFEDANAVKKVVTTLGMPTYLLELRYDSKEVEKRYMKKNEVAELNEEEKAKIEKQIETYENTKAELDDLLAKMPGKKRSCELNSDTTEESLVESIKKLYEPKLVLIKCDNDPSIKMNLINLSITHNFLYISVPDMIQREIEEQTALGIELLHTKKPRELAKDVDPYCSAHYETKTVLQLLREKIKRISGKYQTVIVSGYLSAYRLDSWEEKQEFRVMDELFAVEKEVGEIKAVVSFVKDCFESVEDDRKREKLEVKVKPPPKPHVEGEEKKEEGEEPQENKEEAKVEFKPEQFMWTNTVGKPRSLGQLFAKWKECKCVNYKQKENLEKLVKKLTLDSSVSSGALFIQMKVSN